MNLAHAHARACAFSLLRRVVRCIVAVGLIVYLVIEVILLGGTLFKHSVVTMGAAMTEALARHRVSVIV